MRLRLLQARNQCTGGGRGIGLACAREFLREGAKVSLVGRTAAHLDDAVAQLRTEGHTEVRGHSANLSDAGAALAMLDAAEAELGPMDGAATPMLV
ncbi:MULTISPECIES: SDR family NAD(P)-dependent oxidoreductase [unclassified Variovorax]|uniref:SDR family NAD(P)-dependent oxidoreductase n=1 Tax=unclassified Variovorax TaxID=663243 RepID=UPI003ED02239